MNGDDIDSKQQLGALSSTDQAIAQQINVADMALCPINGVDGLYVGGYVHSKRFVMTSVGRYQLTNVQLVGTPSSRRTQGKEHYTYSIYDPVQQGPG